MSSRSRNFRPLAGSLLTNVFIVPESNERLGKVKMSSFSSRWKATEESQSSLSDKVGSQIKNAFRSPEPLKPKLELAAHQIQVQITRLNSVSTRLTEKETNLFNKVVLLLQKRDNQRANMIANELSEIRKMNKFVTQARLALEQIE